MQTNCNATSAAIDFLSLELTNLCNLECSHCYADAGPTNPVNELLRMADHEELIKEGFQLGARKIQFIGGEPTLNRNLPQLISYAHETGYEFIEVFSNLTKLTPDLVDCFEDFKVKVATSVYAPTASVHDGITKRTGSFARTVESISNLLARGIEIRVGVIEMEANEHLVDATRSMLNELGVENIGGDRVRRVGRGEDGNVGELSELCGGCNGKTLCVGSDGTVSPCIMSKKMAIGSIRENTLSELSESEALSRLKENLSKKPGMYSICTPKTCNPYSSCTPKYGPGPCEPSGCNPCYPKG